MGIIDWIIIIAFIGTLMTIGFIFSHRNRNVEDYFLGGRQMGTWLVALAATGTSVSAGTFVGSPELGFNTNLTYMLIMVGAVFGGLIVAWLFLPKLYKANTITVYGYIGQQYGETSKRATSIVFLLGQLLTSGSRLFIAAIAVSVIIFGSINFIFLVYSIIILGVVSTIYTMLGGIKGLIYIDTIQILIVVGTGVVALLLVYLSLPDTLNFGDIIDTLRHGQVKTPGGWEAGNKLTVLDPSFRFDVPYTIIGGLIGYAIFKVAQFTTDQEFVQRQLTCKNAKEAGASLVYSQFIAMPIVLVFLSIGLLLYVKYLNNPDPMAVAAFRDARDIFPQYICNCIPVGVRGLMMVGLLAAALSSFNSAINAMSSSFVADLYLPIRKQLGKEVKDDADQISSSKKMTILMGVMLTAFAVVTAVMQEKSNLNLVDFCTGVMSFSYAGMMGVFICAFFTKRGNTASIISAMVVGALVVLLLQPYVLGPLTNALFGKTISIAWTWWTVIGTVISFGICCLGKKKEVSTAA